MGVKLTWEPKAGLKKMLERVNNRRPLNRKLCTIMLALVNTTHRHAGEPRWKVSKRAEKEGGRTGYKHGHLQGAWRPVAGKARIENNKSYACDFYYGHGPRTVQVPASYRRIKRSVKLSGQKRKRKQHVATSMVKAHTKRERAQPARPIRWTRRYIGYAEEAVLKHILK